MIAAADASYTRLQDEFMVQMFRPVAGVPGETISTQYNRLVVSDIDSFELGQEIQPPDVATVCHFLMQRRWTPAKQCEHLSTQIR